MNVLELKQLIKETAAKIKTLKTYLREPHTPQGAPYWQSDLCTLKRQIRAYYYLYAFLRGRSPETVEGNRKLLSEAYGWVTWYGYRQLTEEARPLFKEWLKPVA